MSVMAFPQDFIWGAATVAFQIEGAAREDSKGVPIWNSFCCQPGKAFGGHTGDTVCGHYYRFKEDIAL